MAGLLLGRFFTVGRRIDIDELVDATVIAQRLGVRRPQVVHDWRRRHSDFPPPVYSSARATLWVWSEVAAWATTTGRLDA